MTRPQPPAIDVQRKLVREVAFRTALILLLLPATVGGILHFTASRSDDLAALRQQRLVSIAVANSVDEIATDQEASTYWDDAVLKVRERPLDQDWLDNNLGVWFHTYYHHDETYLLDAGNRPVYAMQGGKRALPRSFAAIDKVALPLARALRRELLLHRVGPEGSAGRTVGAARIAVIEGRPAIVSIKPVISETGKIVQAPASEYLHISVRFLDGDFLSKLSSLYGIDRPRFGRHAAGSASLAVKASDGKTIGYISWLPFEPGKKVEDKMVPVLLLAMAIVGLLLSLLLSHIWKSRLELEASRAQAEHLAFHDSLTGLPNRALFDDRLAHALTARKREVAVLLLDLDRFKNVNDTLGHPAGDELIRQFGLRLIALTREADTIARLGGDEFAIILDAVSAEEADGLASRILKDIRRPFDLFGNEAHVGVSIGIALAGEAGRSRQEIVRKADIALYQAKDSGRNSWCQFTPDMDDSVKLRSTIEDELRHALSSGRGLCLHYQPQIGAGGAVAGLEALVRWEHPTKGLIAPDQFVPIAEETGLIIPLGEWVLQEACLASRRWPDLFTSINLSPLQLRSSGFIERLFAIVRDAGANPHKIQLEVTERVLLDDDENVKQALDRLRGQGFAIVLDDFGTGYSSLGYLRKFEVDKIKIDKSFIQHLGENSDSTAIVTAVLALGQALGLEVTAEGVETAEQRGLLDIAGCKEMQGYYFSKALPADEIERLIASPSASSAAA